MLRFVINLDRSVDRLSFMTQQLDELGVSFSRISAVDGKMLSSEERRSLEPSVFSLSRAAFPRSLSAAEVGCFLSHRKCWEAIANSDEDWGLIMEDDIILSPSATPFLKDPSWIPDGVDIVQLYIVDDTWTAKVSPQKYIVQGTNYHLSHPLKPTPVGSLAYVISHKATLLAMSLSKKLIAPIDEFLFSPHLQFARTFPVWRLNPAIAKHAETASTIGDSRRLEAYTSLLWKIHPYRFYLRMRLSLMRKKALPEQFTFK